MDKKDLTKIELWQEKLHHDFGDSKKLYDFIFHTLDQFYHRYIETTDMKDLRTTAIAPNTFGAESFETNVLEFLKIKHPESKKILIDLAKKIPKSDNPTAYFSLKIYIDSLSTDKGKLIITSEVRGLESFKKEMVLEYNDLTHLRKNLALRLEECCEIFL